MSEKKKDSKKSIPSNSKAELSSKPAKEDSQKGAEKTVSTGKTKPKTESKKELENSISAKEEKSKSKIESKKELDNKVGDKEEKSKARVEKQPSFEERKPLEGDPNKEDNPEEEELSEDMQRIFKSVAKEFDAVSDHFASVLMDTLKRLSSKEGWKETLLSKNGFYRAHEQLASMGLAVVKHAFAHTCESYKNYDEVLRRLLGGTAATRDQAELFASRHKSLQEQISKAFATKSNEETRRARDSYETVTAASLEADAKHRLLSANIHKAEPGTARELSREGGAADRSSNTKREVAASLYDKTFVGCKSLTEVQVTRRDLATKDARLFAQYQLGFGLKPSPDINLKGMGRLRS